VCGRKLLIFASSIHNHPHTLEWARGSHVLTGRGTAGVGADTREWTKSLSLPLLSEVSGDHRRQTPLPTYVYLCMYMYLCMYDRFRKTCRRRISHTQSTRRLRSSEDDTFCFRAYLQCRWCLRRSTRRSELRSDTSKYVRTTNRPFLLASMGPKRFVLSVDDDTEFRSRSK